MMNKQKNEGDSLRSYRNVYFLVTQSFFGGLSPYNQSASSKRQTRVLTKVVMVKKTSLYVALRRKRVFGRSLEIQLVQVWLSTIARKLKKTAASTKNECNN